MKCSRVLQPVSRETVSRSTWPAFWIVPLVDWRCRGSVSLPVGPDVT